MAIKNPLSLYSPSAPGRGAGTILKQPDLTGYAARQMKLTDLKLKQKQDEDALKVKKLSDIITVDGDIWLNDQKYFEDRINEFQKEAMSVWVKSNGNPDAVSIAKLKQKQSAIESEMKESKFHEQQRKEAIPRIEAFAATGKYDEQDVTDAFTKWEEWSKLTPSERAKQTPQTVLDQPFNWVTYNDKSIVKPATSKPEKAAYYTTATIGGKERPVIYSNEVYTTKQASDDLWRHIGQGGKYETGAYESYNAWLNQNPNKTYSYTEITTDGLGNNKRVVETKKDVQINSFDDWVNNVQASQNSFNRLGAAVGSGGSSGTSVTVNTPTGTPVKTQIPAKAPTSTKANWGDVTVKGYRYDANKVIDEKSGVTFIPSVSARTISGNKAEGGVVQATEANILQVAKTDITWKSNGKTIAVTKKGEIIGNKFMTDAAFDSWLLNNKDKYEYEPYVLVLNTSQKEQIADKFSSQKSFIVSNFGIDWYNYIIQEAGKLNGISSQTQNTNTGATGGTPKFNKNINPN